MDFLVFLLPLLLLFSSRSETPEKRQADNREGAFAVIELFTSQGCSSCPPADKLLTELLEESERKGTPLYGLSFHVDYWNSLGWKDPFSSAAWTERQRKYARHLRTNVYTPMMVVNGAKAFVGSDRSQARDAIGAALEKAGEFEIHWEVVNYREDLLQLKAKYIGETEKNLNIHAALVESGLSAQVSRGENKGRELRHSGVVRAFTTVGARPGEEKILRLRVPKNLVKEKSEVVLYLQDPEGMDILGVVRGGVGMRE